MSGRRTHEIERDLLAVCPVRLAAMSVGARECLERLEIIRAETQSCLERLEIIRATAGEDGDTLDAYPCGTRQARRTLETIRVAAAGRRHTDRNVRAQPG